MNVAPAPVISAATWSPAGAAAVGAAAVASVAGAGASVPGLHAATASVMARARVARRAGDSFMRVLHDRGADR